MVQLNSNLFRQRARHAWALLVLCVCIGACTSQPRDLPARPVLPALEHLGTWGTSGDGPGQLKTPSAIATDFAGNIYLTDAGSGFIHKFSPAGTPLLSFQQPGLKSPSAVIVDSGGAIYVADSQRGVMHIFLPDGRPYRTVRLGASARGSIHLALGASDAVYVVVTEPPLARKLTFSASGKESWEELQAASSDASVFGHLAVSDTELLIAVPGQNCLKLIPFAGGDSPCIPAPGASELSGGVAATASHILAADAMRHLYIWRANGGFDRTLDLSEWVHSPSPPLVVGKKSELFVLDAAPARVHRFRLNL